MILFRILTRDLLRTKGAMAVVFAFITVDSSALKESGVMDISFVRRNRAFDFLLDLENTVYAPGRGEVGVPLYYQERDDLQLRDSRTFAVRWTRI